MRNHNLQRLRELKFTRMSNQEIRNLLHDLVKHKHITIHIERGTSQSPSEIVNKILASLTGDSSKRIIIFDDNFINEKKSKQFEKKGQCVRIEQSHKVYGIQIADIVAGSIRSHFEGEKSFTKIIDNKLCENSKKIIHPSI